VDELWVTGPPGWPAQEYVDALDGQAMGRKSYRHTICKYNPLLFSLLYFPHRMMTRDPDGAKRVHLNDLNTDGARRAVAWSRTDIGLGEIRQATVAPRGGAKSTTMMNNAAWAMAFGHLNFIALFGATAKAISTTHFTNIKKEFAENELLRYDFPNLTTPSRKPTAFEYRASSGRIMVAKGLDESNLGLNIDNMRPDGLFIDDPEKDEGNHSLRYKEKRLATFRQAVLGMNLRAVVQWMGTTTAYNCLAHDLVRDAVDESTADWVRELKMKTFYYPAIMTNPDGSQRSLWPSMWPLEYLLEHRGERDFELNLMNRPLSGKGTMWRQEHIKYGIPAGWDISRRIIRIDPAVTSKTTSDFTGICVAGYASNVRRVAIEDAHAIRVSPEGLKRNVEMALQRWPGIREIQVEGNQGGEYVARALAGLPRHIRVSLPRSSSGKSKHTAGKDVRFGVAFGHYEKGLVRHAGQFRVVEDQMFSFPDPSVHDDGADAVVGAVNELLYDAVKLQNA
jgi:phage terminase large subunit-like protein